MSLKNMINIQKITLKFKFVYNIDIILIFEKKRKKLQF